MPILFVIFSIWLTRLDRIHDKKTVTMMVPIPTAPVVALTPTRLHSWQWLLPYASNALSSWALTIRHAPAEHAPVPAPKETTKDVAMGCIAALMATLWATNALAVETITAIILAVATAAPTMLRRVGVTKGDKAMAITAPVTAPATLKLLGLLDIGE